MRVPLSKPCFESADYSFLTGPGDGGFKDRVTIDRSFGDIVRAFIAEDTLVTWDPDEFDVKWIQGGKKVIDMTAKKYGRALGRVCRGAHGGGDGGLVISCGLCARSRAALSVRRDVCIDCSVVRANAPKDEPA